MATPIQIDVISDTICPWCFIGKRRLEKALSQRPDIPVDVRWRPFQLDSTIPPAGIDRQSYLDRKFGGPDGARAVYARIEEAGAAEGIPFAFNRISRTPNTVDSHRLIRWAATAGVQHDVVEALFTAYFLAGLDIGDSGVLTQIAAAAGMDETMVDELLRSAADVDLVEKEVALAHQLGVSGVPCFVFANRRAVMGAQADAILVQTLEQAHEEHAQATGTNG